MKDSLSFKSAKSATVRLVWDKMANYMVGFETCSVYLVLKPFKDITVYDITMNFVNPIPE